MNKLPRFLKEYANHKKQSITNNELMQEKYKEKGVSNIDKALKAYEKGLITIDESMKMILDCFA